MPMRVESGYIQWQYDCHFCNLVKSDRTVGVDPRTNAEVLFSTLGHKPGKTIFGGGKTNKHLSAEPFRDERP
jgi:hypothetical protein